MHLVGPWLTTTGKKKGKKKFASAEQKKKLDQLALMQEEMYKKYGISKESLTKTKPTFKTLQRSPTNVRYENRQYIPSLNSNAGDTSLRESLKYSGERKLLGVAVMHKSNLVPIFDQKEAEEISRMRR